MDDYYYSHIAFTKTGELYNSNDWFLHIIDYFQCMYQPTRIARGMRYLREYTNMINFLSLFGIEYPLTNQTTFNISSNVVNNIKIKHNITKRSIPSLNWDDIKYQEPTISEYDKCVQNMEYFNTILSPSGEIIKPTGFFGFMKMTVSRLACVFKKYVTISKILRNSRELENLHIFNNIKIGRAHV